MIAAKVANVRGLRLPGRRWSSWSSSPTDRPTRTVDAARRGGRDARARPAARGQAAGAQRAEARRRRARCSCSPTPTRCSSPARCAALVANFADATVGGGRRQRGPRVERGRPAGGARRGPLLALRAAAQAARGPGRQRGLGQRPPLRGAPRALFTPSDADRGHRRLPDLEPGRHGPAGGSRSTSARVVLVDDARRGRHRAAPQGARDEPRAAVGARARRRRCCPRATGALRARGDLPQGPAPLRGLLPRRAARRAASCWPRARPGWWIVLAPQLAFYALAVGGRAAGRARAAAASSRSGSPTSSASPTARRRSPSCRWSAAASGVTSCGNPRVRDGRWQAP